MTEVKVKVKALTRDEIRTALFAGAPKSEVRAISLFGVNVELHQPSLRSILDVREDDDVMRRTTDVFIKYAFVPGTNEPIFEDTDRDMILNWPFSEDLVTIQTAIAEMTGVDIGAAEEELKTDPLED